MPVTGSRLAGPLSEDSGNLAAAALLPSPSPLVGNVCGYVAQLHSDVSAWAQRKQGRGHAGLNSGSINHGLMVRVMGESVAESLSAALDALEHKPVGHNLHAHARNLSTLVVFARSLVEQAAAGQASLSESQEEVIPAPLLAVLPSAVLRISQEQTRAGANRANSEAWGAAVGIIALSPTVLRGCLQLMEAGIESAGEQTVKSLVLVLG